MKNISLNLVKTFSGPNVPNFLHLVTSSCLAFGECGKNREGYLTNKHMMMDATEGAGAWREEGAWRV